MLKMTVSEKSVNEPYSLETSNKSKCCLLLSTELTIQKFVSDAQNGPLNCERRRYDTHCCQIKLAATKRPTRYLAEYSNSITATKVDIVIS